MKSILSLVLVFSALTVNAKTDIIKPVGTLDSAKGIISVKGVSFDYSVLDRGWTTFGEIVPQFNVIAEKSFILSYEVQDKITQAKAASLQKIVEVDAEKKCLELGEIEYKDQISSFDQTYTKELSEKIESDIKPNFNSTSFAFSAVCLIKVQITK